MVIKTDTYLLTAALNRVIPPVGDLPGAGGMELAEEVIKRSAADFRFQDALTKVLGALPSPHDFLALDDDEPDDALRTAESSQAAAFGLWLDVVYTVYYMHPEVHQRLGWHGRSPQPEGNVMPPWDESVLGVIRKRDPFWRKA
jgi:hypothetical protein